MTLAGKHPTASAVARTRNPSRSRTGHPACAGVSVEKGRSARRPRENCLSARQDTSVASPAGTVPRPRAGGAARARLAPLLVLALGLGFAPLVAPPVAAQDLPGPAPNLELIPAGSLVIPMDNAHQTLVAPFNIKAYGLVNNLLQNKIPVKWAIKA